MTTLKIKIMKCSNKTCKRINLTEKDFYWHNRNENRTLKSTECKHCLLEKLNNKNQQKRIEKNMFSWI